MVKVLSQAWLWLAMVGGAIAAYPVIHYFTGTGEQANPALANLGSTTQVVAAAPPAAPPRAAVAPPAAAPAGPAANRAARQAQLFTDDEKTRKRRERQAELFAPAQERAPKTEPATVDAIQPAALPMPVENPNDRWVAFVVPGTYGNSGSWFTLREGQATFSSELQRSLGPNGRVHPFPWGSSIHHAVREREAKSLADEIKKQTAPGDKVMLVGHSHGGNIALRAAGLCGRKIDLVVCLATPHIYCHWKEGAKNYSFPVYCSPTALKNVTEIVTLTACTDQVPDHYADFRTGISKDQAVDATRDWHGKFPGAALAADGDWVTELVEDTLNTKLDSLVFTNAKLNVASRNIVFPCVVPCNLGEGAHQTVHSRRIGSLLGGLALASEPALRRQTIDYLQLLTQSPGEDSGEAIAENIHRQREREREAKFVHSGWYLREAEITSRSNHDRTTHLFPSDPDPYFQFRSAAGDLFFVSSHRQDSKIAKWHWAGIVLPVRGEAKLQVCERNPVTDDLLETKNLTIGAAGPPKAISAGTWSAKLTWLPVHE